MTELAPTSSAAPASSAAAFAPGFSDPVQDSQRCFRALMQAMARPGSLQAFEPGTLNPPTPLTAAMAAAALTLTDYDTSIWLDPSLAANEDVRAYLKFHTGAPITANPAEAAFALVRDPARLPALGAFAQGTPEYPDRSTTLVLHAEKFDAETSVILQGPGIRATDMFSVAPLPTGFWDQLSANNRQFPRGVDVIFAGADGFAAIPRSTSLTKPEA